MTQQVNNLLEYLSYYNDDAVDSGFSFYNKHFSKIKLVKQTRIKFRFEVGSAIDTTILYEVALLIALDGEVDDQCSCPAHKRFSSCKHTMAAMLYLLIDEWGTDVETVEEIWDYEYEINLNKAENTMTEKSPATMIEIPFSNTDSKPASTWKSFSSSVTEVFYKANTLAGYDYYYYRLASKIRFSGVKTDAQNHPNLTFEIALDKKTVFISEIKFDRDETFYYRCNCPEKSKLCPHVMAAFERLKSNYGSKYFYQFKDWAKEKNTLLQTIGIAPDTPEAALVEFHLDYYGKLQMKKPGWLLQAQDEVQLNGLKTLFAKGSAETGTRPKLLRSNIIDFETGFLLNLVSQHFKLGFELELMKVFHKNNSTQFKKLSIHQNENLPLLSSLPDEVYHHVMNLSEQSLLSHLKDCGYGNLTSYGNPWPQIESSEKAFNELRNQYLDRLFAFWDFLTQQEHVYVLREGKFANHNIKPVKLSASKISFGFKVVEEERFITISLLKNMDNETVEATDFKLHHGFLFEIENVFYLPQNREDLGMLKLFQTGFVKIPLAQRTGAITTVIPLLQKKYPVLLPDSLRVQQGSATPVPQLLLKEMDKKYLILQPQYKYEDEVVDFENAPENRVQSLPDGSYLLIERDEAAEKAFFEEIRTLHPLFQKQFHNEFLFLPFDDALKQNWFIETVRRLQEAGIPVLGITELEKFRFNTNKPKWEMKVGSGIDWFDLEIEVSFGDQLVPLREVRKAVISKQNVVVLGDGSFGVLPEEWLQQFGLLLKMGEAKQDDTLRLNKLHFTLIDDLHEKIQDEEILKELHEKKQKLQNIESIKALKPSKKVTATLRPYQLSGFQWMQTLDELGWGGCLADDMGLGKTLQTITFLQYLKEKYKGCTSLVVCPTSLIYNWESELIKFAPNLRYHIYYGSEREITDQHFEDYDIIISSYGLIRNDLEEMIKHQWHYVILDESQAIKNPDAQTTKAVQLLKAKNRFILSGTPVQNNTFDLFAQFHFLNPGLLGNKEFYKNEFANAIDKHNDAEKSEQLRKLVYPFLLRRTKEQVATDLPDKTETILWCEMSKEQRAVYEEYKNYYRTALLQKIEEVGMAKAGMYVLEGLLRLRQICDSPELVKDKAVRTKKSIKIEELLREIQENSSNHKSLIFSQFTEMLHLIEAQLQQQQIAYCYLDGSTTIEKRKEAVHHFQNNTDIKLFLISLKAGGVGLNLTAADYVYLVDPWWNPAVEQQAIDRTHRIGQKNKIFAYKMICKDTVEEKILQLQQKKKQLANEIVSADAGFVKKLNKADIEFLFS